MCVTRNIKFVILIDNVGLYDLNHYETQLTCIFFTILLFSREMVVFDSEDVISIETQEADCSSRTF